MHFTPSMVPLSYQFYASLVIVSIVGAVCAFCLTLAGVYGIGGMELVLTVGFISFFGLLRLYRQSTSSMGDYDPNLWEENSSHNLAIETFELEEIKHQIPSSSCCPICLYEFQSKDQVSIAVTCKHAYHSECLKLWLPKSATCPYCRHDLIQKYPEDAGSSTSRKHGSLGIFEGIFDSIYL
jgi:Ring finger domain